MREFSFAFKGDGMLFFGFALAITTTTTTATTGYAVSSSANDMKSDMRNGMNKLL